MNKIAKWLKAIKTAQDCKVVQNGSNGTNFKITKMVKISKWTKLLRYLNCQIGQPICSKLKSQNWSEWPKRIRFQNGLNCQISPTLTKMIQISQT